MTVRKVNPTKEEIDIVLEKAKRRIHSAEVLLEAKEYNDAISRAYYAFFDGARAALLTKNLVVKTHGGVLTFFSKYFVKTEKMPKIFSKYLRRAFKARQEADYQDHKHFDEQEVKDAIRLAKKFIKEIEKIIK